MRKKLVALCIMFSFLLAMVVGCKKDTELTTVNLTEVAHSIFYAPMYVALEEGYFQEEGLNVVLTNGLGADKTMTAVLSGKAN